MAASQIKTKLPEVDCIICLKGAEKFLLVEDTPFGAKGGCCLVNL